MSCACDKDSPIPEYESPPQLKRLRMMSETKPSPKKSSVILEQRDGGGLTSDAHISTATQIQASQISHQPVNIWYRGTAVTEEPDSPAVSNGTPDNEPRGMLPTVSVQFPTGRGTTVAILDSGINMNHTAFRDLAGGNFMKISIDSKSFVGESCTDTHGHGTQCAGLLCGSYDDISTSNSNEFIPFQGIAVDSQVMACKVVRDGTAHADIEAVCNAIEYVVKYNREQSGKKVDVITLSFGMAGFDHKLTKAIQEAVCEGIIIVCAASNDGRKSRQPITYPARLGQVLCIGACSANGKPCDFSPVGRELDFLAPGEGIWAPTFSGDRDYAIVNGTSFSAPLVAGIICRLIEDLRRFLSEDDVQLVHNVWCMRELLKEMAVIQGKHSEERGYGALDPPQYFDKDDNEKIRIIKKILQH